MKQKILKKHNPTIIFLANFPCHASVVVYCLVFLELTSLLQGCFSALNTLSALWLLSDTTSTGYFPPVSDTLLKRPLLPTKIRGAAQSQGFSSSKESSVTICWLTQLWFGCCCSVICLPSLQVRLSRRAPCETPPNPQGSPCARAFLPPCGVFYENRISQKQPGVLKQSVTKEAWAISAYVFIPHLSCCSRLCNRVKVLPTITLNIPPDLQYHICHHYSTLQLLVFHHCGSVLELIIQLLLQKNYTESFFAQTLVQTAFWLWR